MAIVKMGLSGVNNVVKYDDMLADNNPFADYWVSVLYANSPTGIGNISVNDIVTDSSNNIYLSGNSNYGATKCGLWKLSSQANMLAANNYANSAGSIGVARAGIDSSNNIYYSAQQTDTATGSIGSFNAKVNSSNVSQWASKVQINVNYGFTFGGGRWASTSTGGITYNVFQSNGRGGVGSNDWHINAASATGTEKWGPYYIDTSNASIYPYPTGVVAIDDNNAVSIAYKNDGARNVGWVAKVTGTSSASLAWGNAFYNPAASGNNATYPLGVAKDSSGNVFVVGTTYDDAVTGTQTGFIGKYNSSGTLQWFRRVYTGVAGRYVYLQSIAIDSSGNVYGCGFTYSTTGQQIGLIVKYNTSGTLQWQRTMQAGTSLSFSILTIDSADNLILYATMNTASSLDPLYNGKGIYRLKSDGSLTGTYSLTTGGYTNTWIYATSSLTSATWSPTTTTGLNFSNTSGSRSSSTGASSTQPFQTYRVRSL